MCFKSVQRIYTHTHICIFDLLRKKVHATVSPMNPCVVRVESDAKKIVNFRHFFPSLFAARLFVVSLTRALYTLLHSPPTGRE